MRFAQWEKGFRFHLECSASRLVLMGYLVAWDINDQRKRKRVEPPQEPLPDAA